MTTLQLWTSPRSAVGSLLASAQKEALSVLKQTDVVPNDAMIAALKWSHFRKFDLVTLTHFGGMKSEQLTWREFGDMIEAGSALFVLKASFECARILDSGDKLTEQLAIAIDRLARARANMAVAPVWASGMGTRAGPRERPGAHEAQQIRERVRGELPTWNRNTAGKLARELQTTPKTIRTHKRDLEKKSERIR